jgi:hypothetical protein
MPLSLSRPNGLSIDGELITAGREDHWIEETRRHKPSTNCDAQYLLWFQTLVSGGPVRGEREGDVAILSRNESLVQNGLFGV